MTYILFFGDSVAYGAWDLEGGWPQRLRRFLDKKVIDSNYEEYYITYNLGIDGDTSRGLLKRFPIETKSRIPEGEEAVFIFHIGDNDSFFNNRTKKSWVSKAEYEKNLKKLIAETKRYKSKVVFLGSFPVDEEKTDPVQWVKDHSYKNGYLEEYRQVLEKTCKKANCHFLNLSDKIELKEWIKFLPDGVHPNTKGYEITFDIIKKFLIEKEII